MIVDEQHDHFRWRTGVSVELSEFPHLLRLFQTEVKGTDLIEQQGELLARNDFPNEELEKFIREVCKWGGYSGVAQRVINQNPPESLTSRFRAANTAAHDGDAIAALEKLLQLKQLAISFASKHLKFVAPNQAVVLDSIISERLYGEGKPSVGLYKMFLADCRSIRQRIISEGLEYTGWAQDGWRVSDVEMALFAKLKPRKCKKRSFSGRSPKSEFVINPNPSRVCWVTRVACSLRNHKVAFHRAQLASTGLWDHCAPYRNNRLGKARHHTQHRAP
jgi:hypothetical protein